MASLPVSEVLRQRACCTCRRSGCETFPHCPPTFRCRLTTARQSSPRCRGPSDCVADYVWGRDRAVCSRTESNRAVLLSSDWRTRAVGWTGVGSHSWCARVHAAGMFIPGSPSRIRGAWRHGCGVSTQTTAYQQEFVERNHLPFDLFSDAELRLTHAMRLPTFEFRVLNDCGPTTLIKRMARYVDAGRIVNLWYPVFPPDKNADTVLTWLRTSRLTPRSHQ